MHQLRGVALALWLVFTSARTPYRELVAAPESEVVEGELSEAHCTALGVTAATDPARRRTFNEAGRRVCRPDTEFEAFEAHGGCGRRGVDHRLQQFSVAERAAGQARDPQTGEPLEVPAGRSPRFSAGAKLKQAVPAKGLRLSGSAGPPRRIYIRGRRRSARSSV